MSVEKFARYKLGISDPLTLYMCCPVSDGASAVVICSEKKARQYGTGRAIYVAGSVCGSPQVDDLIGGPGADIGGDFKGGNLTKRLAPELYDKTGIGPEDIDVAQMHDPFSLAMLVVLPTYFPLADQQVVEHFRAVARAVSCPVALYINPKFAMWDFTVETLRQLAEEANIRYLKDASGNIGKLMSIVTALGDRFKIFSATAHVPVFVLMLGGVGWMAGPACLIPEQSIALYELAYQKRWEEALELQKKLWPLNVAFQRYSLAACVKAGLEMQGFPVGPPLPPQRQLDEEGKKVVSEILIDIGVL